MKGMELSRAYFEEYGKPLIDTRLLQYRPYIAAGLVGEGSECLGFDDDISTDHDFGPAFCIWVPEWLYQQAGAELKSAYDSLPAEYHGYKADEAAAHGQQGRPAGADAVIYLAQQHLADRQRSQTHRKSLHRL